MMALGKKKVDKTLIDLRVPVRDAVDLVRAGLRPPVQLHSDIPRRPVMCMADQTAVMQIILNLCINARDAVGSQVSEHAEGKIIVCMGPPDQDDARRAFDMGTCRDGSAYIKITVSDNGPGMCPATRENIFTPYFSTKGERGTGLGLPIVVGAVRDHGGALAVETAPGQGTVFTIMWPLDNPVPQSLPAARKGCLHGASFLVVGHDTRNLRALTGLLESAGGLGVPCDNVRDAEEFLLAEVAGWDMVFLDGSICKDAASSVIKAIQRARNDLPVVVLTENEGRNNKFNGAALVVDQPGNTLDFLPKIMKLLKQ